MAQIVSDSLRSLQAELTNHPDIKEQCKECTSFSEMIGTIAAEVDMIVDGYYTPEDLEGMFISLRYKLEQKRRSVHDFNPILLS